MFTKLLNHFFTKNKEKQARVIPHLTDIPFKLFMQLVSQSPLSQKTFTTPAELLLSSDSFSSTLSATRVAVVPS